MKTLLARAVALASALYILALCFPVRAADLGGPAPAAPAAQPYRPYWTSCYVDAGASGRVLLDAAGSSLTNVAVLGGLGCTYQVGGMPFREGHSRPVVIGAFVRGGASLDDLSRNGAALTFDQPVTVGARFGLGIGHTTLLYGIVGQTFSRSLGKSVDGPTFGGGLETGIWGSLSIAAEYTWDDTSGRLDAHGVSVMLRHRF